MSVTRPKWKTKETYHVINLVYSNQPRRQLEHVVPQRDNNKLCILRPLLDVSRND